MSVRGKESEDTDSGLLVPASTPKTPTTGNHWVKGMASPNPSGRAKGLSEVQQYASTYSVEAIEKLVDIMRTGRDHEARHAATALLNRAHGMPSQHVGLATGANESSAMVVAVLRKLAGEGETP